MWFGALHVVRAMCVAPNHVRIGERCESEPTVLSLYDVWRPSTMCGAANDVQRAEARGDGPLQATSWSRAGLWAALSHVFLTRG